MLMLLGAEVAKLRIASDRQFVRLFRACAAARCYLLPVRVWGSTLVTVGLVATLGAGGCASPPPRMAALQTFITGEGTVTVEYAPTGAYSAYLDQDDPDCDSGLCISRLSGGSNYEPGVNVTLTAAPSPGWKFQSWNVIVWGKGGPSDHSSTSTTGTEATLVVQNAGQQMYVYATFGADADDAGASTIDASVADSPGE
jgi:hypothetical protein